MASSITLTRRIEMWLTAQLSALLVRPLRSYEQRVPNSVENLKQQLRKGDVILVEGDQRVSQVIKYLTQSSWSHTAIYVGDELRRYNPALAQELAEKLGDDSRYLVLEADNAGVLCSPISKYKNHNIRICRPRNLRREDLDKVFVYLFRQLGRRYNFRHIIELARYFLPVTVVPRRFRRTMLHYGGEHKHEVICSTLLARAFGSVGYPVLPRVTIDEIAEQPTRWQRLLGRNGAAIRALYREEDPALITPRDFDLSPYFDIVKINYLCEPKFDYRRIAWAHLLEKEVAEDAVPDPNTAAAE
ncbi:MAG TPA: YiiX/YebB-like N1pC/P60 family cysteine hydrolase [Terriglobales bacterium]|nr:YiiX/YebB-like N1pC/P60 family cysteine hydrolase [Terriglobales bacterium]